MYALQAEAYRMVRDVGSPGDGSEQGACGGATQRPASGAGVRIVPGFPPYGHQVEAYRTVQNCSASGREIEAAALTRCALLLSACRQHWDAPDREPRLADALRTNQKVWSILQAELTRKDNPLPKPLREELLSLGLFVDRRIFAVMAEPSPEKLKILIEINLNIAAGLRGRGGEAR